MGGMRDCPFHISSLYYFVYSLSYLSFTFAWNAKVFT